LEKNVNSLISYSPETDEWSVFMKEGKKTQLSSFGGVSESTTYAIFCKMQRHLIKLAMKEPQCWLF